MALPQQPNGPLATGFRLAWHRKLWMSLVPLLLLLVVAEGVAWFLDSRWHFRYELLNAFSQIEISNRPVPALNADQLPGPVDTIIVRSEKDPPGTGNAYRIGGQVIPNAHASQAVMHVQRQEIGLPFRRRIIVVGGSAALGLPYAYGDSFAGQLQRFASRDDYLVINCARRAWLSGEVAAVADRATRFFTPDTLVVMTGNNEWLHWQVDHPKLRKTIDGLSWRRTLANSRLLAFAQYTSMKRIIDERHLALTADSEYTADRTLTGYHDAIRYPLEDFTEFDAAQWLEVKQRFLDVFEHNLTHIVEMARERNVRVILLTVPFRYKLSPAWKHPQPESFDPRSRKQVRKAIHTAAAWCDKNAYEKALRTIEAALAIDSYPPVAHYLRGYCLEHLGKSLEAEQAYAECREQMIGNLGSRLSINRRIRRVSRATNTPLVDVENIFAEHNHAAKRYFNVDLVHDDCHPTPQGHALIATALAAELGINVASTGND